MPLSIPAAAGVGLHHIITLLAASAELLPEIVSGLGSEAETDWDLLCLLIELELNVLPVRSQTPD